MMFSCKLNRVFAVMLFLALALGNVQAQAAPVQTAKSSKTEATASYIVQGKDIASAIAAVKRVGGLVGREFNIIRSVNAQLTQSQVAALQKVSGIKVYEDQKMKTSAVDILAHDHFVWFDDKRVEQILG